MAKTMVWAARSHLSLSTANLNSLISLSPLHNLKNNSYLVSLELFPIKIIARMFYYGYTVLSPFDRRGNAIKKRGFAPLKKISPSP